MRKDVRETAVPPNAHEVKLSYSMGKSGRSKAGDRAQTGSAREGPAAGAGASRAMAVWSDVHDPLVGSVFERGDRKRVDSICLGCRCLGLQCRRASNRIWNGFVCEKVRGCVYLRTARAMRLGILPCAGAGLSGGCDDCAFQPQEGRGVVQETSWRLRYQLHIIAAHAVCGRGACEVVVKLSTSQPSRDVPRVETTEQSSDDLLASAGESSDVYS